MQHAHLNWHNALISRVPHKLLVTGATHVLLAHMVCLNMLEASVAIQLLI